MARISKRKKGPKRHIVAVTGGVLSSLGKGVLASSLATLLEAQGNKVTAMKMDPYINVDAGTMNPKEHGEVYVTEDGFETDQDLGNYERFTNSIVTSKMHSITTGQIYQEIIRKERHGHYQGRCVEYSNIEEEIIDRIKRVVDSTGADYTIIELGGTVGETLHQPFLDALRLIKYEGENVRFVHMGLVPIPSKVGEQKTKPLQESIKHLRGFGITPDFVVARSEQPLDDARMQKIARNCSIYADHIISAYDENILYKIPLNMEAQDFDIKILQSFGERYKRTDLLKPWKDLVAKIETIDKTICIGMIGKYQNTGNFTLTDTYLSVIQSLKIAAWHQGRNINIKWINAEDYETNARKISELNYLDGIVVPGGFGERGIEGMIKAIEHARLNKIPFLGLCYGLQLATIEYARNVLGIKDAQTTEISPETKNPVIHMLPEQAKKLELGDFGGSMRLGAYDAELVEGTIVRKLYGESKISERHRHRLEVNHEYVDRLKHNGLVISGTNPGTGLVEFIELPQEKHPYFVGTQAHPEFKSRFLYPSPLFTGLIRAAADK
ncbi:MAG: CTP synthase [Candidatus Woesearchaeota archaeon]